MTAARTRTRDDVVRAASRLFATRGYHGTSMRDLAREVGVLGSSLYSHIDSKEDLLVEIVEIGAQLFQTGADRAVATGGTGAEQLTALVKSHIDVVLDHLDEARTFLYEANALDNGHRQKVTGARDRYEAAFRKAFATGIRDGSFRRDVDPKLAAIMVLSILNAVERWYRPTGTLDRKALASEILAFTTTGVSPPPGEKEDRQSGSSRIAR